MSTDGMSRDSAVDVFDRCAYCHAGFERDVRYPVTVREDDEGDLEIYSFCDSTCQDAWAGEN